MKAAYPGVYRAHPPIRKRLPSGQSCKPRRLCVLTHREPLKLKVLSESSILRPRGLLAYPLCEKMKKSYPGQSSQPLIAPVITPPAHCKKKASGFPVPSRDVTYQTLPGRE
jgi:hypothetical protein